MVRNPISVSSAGRRHGGARPGAGRPQVRAKTTELPSISILALHKAGRLARTAASVALVGKGGTRHVQVRHAPCPFGGSRPPLL
jgi:hypothetical protein